MRRYAVVQRARDADVFGILVGTLGVGTSHLLPLTLRILIRALDRSLVPTTDFTPARPPLTRTQKKLHCHSGEAQPRETGELPRDRGVRARRVPRELGARREGVFAPDRDPVRARGRAKADAGVDGAICA